MRGRKAKGAYMRGELGAVEVTLWDCGVSVKSFMMRMAWAMAGTGIGAEVADDAYPGVGEPYATADGGSTARLWSGSEVVGETVGGDDEANELCMTSWAKSDCLACLWPTSKSKKKVSACSGESTEAPVLERRDESAKEEMKTDRGQYTPCLGMGTATGIWMLVREEEKIELLEARKGRGGGRAPAQQVKQVKSHPRRRGRERGQAWACGARWWEEDPCPMTSKGSVRPAKPARGATEWMDAVGPAR